MPSQYCNPSSSSLVS